MDALSIASTYKVLRDLRKGSFWKNGSGIIRFELATSPAIVGIGRKVGRGERIRTFDPWSRTRCATRLRKKPVLMWFSPKSEYLGGKSMDARFEQFIRERQYLANVTPATIEWYRNSLRWLRTASSSQGHLKDAVIGCAKKG
jgi:hypothetical protein